MLVLVLIQLFLPLKVSVVGGIPLVSHEVIVNLIAGTSTKTGLTVQCVLDQNTYEAGIKVSDEELSQINIRKNDFHGEWNYSILPI